MMNFTIVSMSYLACYVLSSEENDEEADVIRQEAEENDNGGL